MGMQQVVCREVVELVTEYLDGALPPDAHAAVALHLGSCAGCVEYMHQLLFHARLRRRTDEG
jgi:hypothetical protein